MQLELNFDANLGVNFDAEAQRSEPQTRLPLELRPGTNRRRHVQAVLEADRVVVTHPPRMHPVEARRIGEQLRERLERRATAGSVDLATRARALADRYELPRPERIEWSDRQQALWGTCSSDGVVRLSTRLAALPRFVLDAVIVHELAHLVHLDHGAEFDALTRRYPKTDLAMGYLMALDHHRSCD
jgi:predicted metal-dependent hydrolase